MLTLVQDLQLVVVMCILDQVQVDVARLHKNYQVAHQVIILLLVMVQDVEM